MADIVSATVAIGKTYAEALQAAGQSTNPTRANYTFAGWNTQADGSGTTVSLTDTVTQSIVLYAQWGQYRLYYNKNNASATGTMEPSIQTGSNVVVKECEFALSGHTFVNWGSEPSGTGGYFFNPGDVMPLGADITLYARWQAN